MSRYTNAHLNTVHHRDMRPLSLPDARPATAVAAWQSRDFLATAVAAWQSRDFLATLYADRNGFQRLSVNRVSIDRHTGQWRDGITWDELQRVKDQCGFADRWAVELYPPADEVVNVAAMRHLWLLPGRPPYAWVR